MTSDTQAAVDRDQHRGGQIEELERKIEALTKRVEKLEKK